MTHNHDHDDLNTDDLLIQNEPAPWLFTPGIDGVAVVAISAVLAVILMARRPNRSHAGRRSKERMAIGVRAALAAATGDGRPIAGIRLVRAHRVYQEAVPNERGMIEWTR